MASTKGIDFSEGSLKFEWLHFMGDIKRQCVVTRGDDLLKRKDYCMQPSSTPLESNPKELLQWCKAMLQGRTKLSKRTWSDSLNSVLEEN